MHKLIQNQVRISVRDLVEFVLRSGDLDNRRSVKKDYDSMQLGSRLHRKIQGKMSAGYRAEVSLKHSVTCNNVEILLEGRADGIVPGDGEFMIDEIKVIRQNMDRLEEPHMVHQAQAVCYGYMYAEMRAKEGIDTERIHIQVTYCHPDSEEIKRFVSEYTPDMLKEEFEGYIREYARWASFLYDHRTERKESINGLEFPYPYRKGQRPLVVTAYKAMINEEELFIQAPTGIGKTLSAVFPAVQAIGQEYADKFFYLTAKTITRTAAVSGIKILREKGLKLSFIALVSKEKLCVCDTMECNPVNCERAKGHFDRVNAAVFDLITNEQEVTREVILEYAEKYNVCPFEMALDVTYWVDAIICDYNYLFDPNVRLQRFFGEGTKGDYIFLVDEAHNLVERAREMYSADIEKEELLEAKKVYSQFPTVARQFGVCNRRMLELKRECDDWKELPDGEGISAFVLALQKLMEDINRLSETNPEWNIPKEATDFFFRLRDFLDTYECIDENYQVYMEHTNEGRFSLKLFCVNPARRLQECCAQGISTIFFSATLLPIQYYRELLCTDPQVKAVYVNSPFDKEKRMIAVASDVSAKYTRRNEREFQRIAGYIDSIIRRKRGNYLVFFPSYSMIDAIEQFMEKDNDTEYIRQENSMSEEKREEFLKRFQDRSNTLSTVGLCVTGGIFSEGIDLQGEAVIGVIIVGTGLAQVNTRQEILKRFYDRKSGSGFNFAYLFPGMNKILQAAGRLIRTDDDYGIIALLDERFLRSEYISLFPAEWFPYTQVRADTIAQKISKFWDDIEKKLDI